jgi:sugar phosphate isomerase/epimerase
MQLGFVSAILPDCSFEEVLTIAADIGYQCVEIMCWPAGKAERRYAGVTHIDVTQFTSAMADDIRAVCEKTGVSISALGYYPNPLTADRAESDVYQSHIRSVIDAAQRLRLHVVNTFVGRDPLRTVEAQWNRFLDVWKPMIQYAEDRSIVVGIENCPMLFSHDEWPGGKNLAISPAIWRRMFRDIPSNAFGLNLDPSHLVWLMIEPDAVIREFGSRIVHVHAKDARLDRHKLQEVGIMGLDWHTPKLPGLGDVDWRRFFGALTDAKYQGPVCVEVEDRAFEGSLSDRKRSLELSFRFLSQYVA